MRGRHGSRTLDRVEQLSLPLSGAAPQRVESPQERSPDGSPLPAQPLRPAPRLEQPPWSRDQAEPGPSGVRFVRHPRARRYILRIDPDGAARVTVPRRGSLREARAFLERQRDWIERQRSRQRHVPRLDGDTAPSRLMLDGEWVEIGVRVDLSRVMLGTWAIDVPAGSTPGAALREWLVDLARDLLPRRLHQIAAAHGLAVAAVAVRDQRSRWGSCSRSGRISLNWRLVQMPPAVRDYILVHELAHVEVPNHSVRFWRAVARMDPDWRASERWLRQHGRLLL